MVRSAPAVSAVGDVVDEHCGLRCNNGPCIGAVVVCASNAYYVDSLSRSRYGVAMLHAMSNALALALQSAKPSELTVHDRSSTGYAVTLIEEARDPATGQVTTEMHVTRELEISRAEALFLVGSGAVWTGRLRTSRAAELIAPKRVDKASPEPAFFALSLVSPPTASPAQGAVTETVIA